MSQDSLNETYLKAKRYLIFFSAILALSSLIGLSPAEESNLLGWSIANPRYTSVVLFIVVLYYLGQLVLFWNVQGKPIRALAQHSADFWMSFVIGASALYSLPTIMLLQKCGVSVFSVNPNEAVLEPFSNQMIVGLSITPMIAVGVYFLIFRPSLIKSRGAVAAREDEVLNVLTNHRWRLVFNPKAYKLKDGKAGSKEMTFHPSGEIKEGKNINENSWRLSSGFLELINSADKVFSRFEYQSDGEKFVHTNDDDTLSIRDQYMLMKEEHKWN